MSRKDFRLIANVIAAVKSHNPRTTDAMRDLENAMVEALQTTNPLFDEKKFRDACNPS